MIQMGKNEGAGKASAGDAGAGEMKARTRAQCCAPVKIGARLAALPVVY